MRTNRSWLIQNAQRKRQTGNGAAGTAAPGLKPRSKRDETTTRAGYPRSGWWFRLVQTRILIGGLCLLPFAFCLLPSHPAAAAVGPKADLVITMVALPLNVPVSGQIDYRIVVTNQGPNLASNVILIDPIPPGLQFVSGHTTRGHTALSADILRGTLGALDVGESAVVDLVVSATVAGEFRNTAVVNSDTQDPDLDNNAATYPASAGPPPPTPPSPTPTSPCAVDVSAAARVTPGMLEYNANTKRFFQHVQVANISNKPIAAPVWLVLDGLAPVVLTNADGVTACQAPLGSPYLQVNVGADGVLQPREVITMTIGLDIPAHHGLVYHPRVLSGTGER
jgi:uncharacterized repeat protein (TIGR01451 family)